MSGKRKDHEPPIDSTVKKPKSHHQRWNKLSEDASQEAIIFGVEKVEHQQYNLFIWDIATDIKHDYGTDLVRFFATLFKNSAWLREVTLVATNGGMEKLGDDQPDRRFFKLCHDESGPLLAELCSFEDAPNHDAKFQCTTIESFLQDFPHRQPVQMWGNKLKPAAT